MLKLGSNLPNAIEARMHFYEVFQTSREISIEVLRYGASTGGKVSIKKNHLIGSDDIHQDTIPHQQF